MSDPTDDGFRAALAAAPEDLLVRRAYADWLDDRDDPRGPYLRLRADWLDPATEAKARARAKRRAAALATQLDPGWVRFVDAHDRLFQIAQRFGCPPPTALRAVWRAAADRDAPLDEYWSHVYVPGSGVGGFGLETTREYKSDRDEYLENNEDVAAAFRRMFREVDFVGGCSDGSLFGYWRCAPGVTAATAPVVYLDTGADFHLGGATLQDFVATADPCDLSDPHAGWTAEDRAGFEEARRCFADRGVATSPTLEAVQEAVRGFPDPEDRFQEYGGQR